MRIDIKDFISFKTSQNATIWDIGNCILYELCERYPRHENIDEIVAKIWLIGRAYAAAIERRKNKNKNEQASSDMFYVEVAHKLISSGIDHQLAKLPKTFHLNEKNIEIISQVHSYLTRIFYDLTYLYKKSLASKYLHFHCPIVPIYDSRATKSITKIFVNNRTYKDLTKRFIRNAAHEFESEYYKFVIKIYCLQQFLFQETGNLYSPRDIDKYLYQTKNKISATFTQFSDTFSRNWSHFRISKKF